MIGTTDQIDTLLQTHFMRSVDHRIKIVLARGSSKPDFTTVAGPLAIRAATRAALRIFSGLRSSLISVAGALAREHTHADAERHAFRGAFNNALVDTDGAGGQIFKIQVGVIAAFIERLTQIGLKIVLSNAKRPAKNDSENPMLPA